MSPIRTWCWFFQAHPPRTPPGGQYIPATWLLGKRLLKELHGWRFGLAWEKRVAVGSGAKGATVASPPLSSIWRLCSLEPLPICPCWFHFFQLPNRQACVPTHFLGRRFHTPCLPRDLRGGSARRNHFSSLRRGRSSEDLQERLLCSDSGHLLLSWKMVNGFPKKDCISKILEIFVCEARFLA